MKQICNSETELFPWCQYELLKYRLKHGVQTQIEPQNVWVFYNTSNFTLVFMCNLFTN